jgi:hypothetical protein
MCSAPVHRVIFNAQSLSLHPFLLLSEPTYVFVHVLVYVLQQFAVPVADRAVPVPHCRNRTGTAKQSAASAIWHGFQHDTCHGTHLLLVITHVCADSAAGMCMCPTERI